MDEDEKYYVSLGMRTYGGSFVKTLGILVAKADSSNYQKLKATFPEYWEEYLEIGKQLREEPA